LFLRLSNCASVVEKNFDNYQDARYVREKKKKTVMFTLFYMKTKIFWNTQLLNAKHNYEDLKNFYKKTEKLRLHVH
jgi:hypothetical protein